MQREACLVGQKLKEIRGRGVQRDLERMIVNRLDAKLIDRLLASGSIFGILDDEQHAGITGSRFRVHQTAEGELEVASGNRIAVRPFRVVAQMEGIDRAILGNIPGFRYAGNGLAVSILNGQAIIKIAQHIAFGNGGRVMMIERGRIGVIAAVQHRLCRGCARERQKTHAHQ